MNSLGLEAQGQLISAASVGGLVTYVPLLLAGCATLCVIGLLAFIVYLLLRKERATLTPEEAKRIVLQAEDRARMIVAEATAEARQARLSIEKERIRALSEDHNEVERFLDAYRFQLDKTMKELVYGAEKEHMRATSSFVESLQALEQNVALNADEAKHSMDSFTKQSSVLFDRLSFEIENVEKGIQHLALALEEAAANESGKNAELVRTEMRKIGEETARAVLGVAKGLDDSLRVNLEKEFKSISAELTRYRETRMRLIDERILVLIEETAQIALQKQLPMQTQSDLVYRALDEAKQRGFFV